MNNPKYVEVNGKRYDINTDFRVALKCDKIARDSSIDDNERGLAIIYLLYGEEALKDIYNHQELTELALKYLRCGKEEQLTRNEEVDMDFEQDMDYIEASFQSDFGISLEDTEMHWYKFNKLLNGLSNSEMGNCCILNRIRNLRSYDTSKIKDAKEKAKIEEAKRMVALKKEPKKNFTNEELKNMETFFQNIERS
jgi:hypothetical protein